MTIPNHDALPEQPIGLAILGLGKWSHQLGRAIRRSSRVRLLTCYTRTAQKREEYATTFGCSCAGSLQEVFETPGLQAAIICTPAYAHTEFAYPCADHGLHLLIEKPMALSLPGALELASTCEDNGVVLMIGHEMRRLGSMRAAKQLLENGALGQVVSASASMTLGGRFTPDNWRCHRDTNRGGALLQLGIHAIENLNYLLGRPVAVRGSFANAVAPGDVDDVGSAIVSYENGVEAVISANYVSPSSQRMSLFGMKANLHLVADMRVWPDAAAVDEQTQLLLEDGVERREIAIRPHDVLLEQVDDFAASIVDGTSPETGAKEGVQALAVVEAALQSVAEGRAVDPQQLVEELQAKGSAHES
ncbi:MAG TPA: Gfo/Idh/MocA family oxidoreductase [Candidatus Binatia bacterium]|jgi:predicted dehydrogenase|nr:Gfo/Idh/MocA family oxidoreductase [Candidatus Binatia bacterium]